MFIGSTGHLNTDIIEHKQSRKVRFSLKPRQINQKKKEKKYKGLYHKAQVKLWPISTELKSYQN